MIKKTLFNAHMLTVIKIIACLITHSVFLVVLFGLIVFQNMLFSFFTIYICMFILTLGLGWTVSALRPFIRDIGQIAGPDSWCCDPDRFLGNALNYAFNHHLVL
jgi:ABC-type polysaccharide/polyol phosphate export permease